MSGHAGGAAHPHDKFDSHEGHVGKHAALHYEDEVKCRQYRAAAEAHAHERDRLAKAAQAAADHGDAEKTHHAREALRKEEAAWEAAQARAAHDIFAFKNTSERVHPNEIDLHGLFTAEALRFLEERLGKDASTAPEARPADLVVIYGAGHASAGGPQAIATAVMALIAKHHLTAVADTPHAGCCTVIYDWAQDAKNLAALASVYKHKAAHHATAAEVGVAPV